MHEASYYSTLPDNMVLCALCPHDCRIPHGSHGFCATRYNRAGRLYTLVYEKVVSRLIEPVEKKPLFHFHPGSLAYSIGTVGCNMRCAFCQNWEISQWPRDHLPKRADRGKLGGIVYPPLEKLQDQVPGRPATPETIVAAAVASGATSIAYTYTEPTVFFELAYDTAVLARKRGLKNILVTNGFTNEAPLRALAEMLDAANVDLKFFRNESYRHISGARLEPILKSIRLYHSLGVWLEVTTLVIPGVNDSEQELKDIARFVHSVGVEIPWHISRFHPSWKMFGVPVTPVETLRKAADIGRAVGLRHIYEGNVSGESGESTSCPDCGSLLIERYGPRMRSNRIRDGVCPQCGTTIAGVGLG